MLYYPDFVTLTLSYCPSGSTVNLISTCKTADWQTDRMYTGCCTLEYFWHFSVLVKRYGTDEDRHREQSAVVSRGLSALLTSDYINQSQSVTSTSYTVAVTGRQGDFFEWHLYLIFIRTRAASARTDGALLNRPQRCSSACNLIHPNTDERLQRCLMRGGTTHRGSFFSLCLNSFLTFLPQCCYAHTHTHTQIQLVTQMCW